MNRITAGVSTVVAAFGAALILGTPAVAQAVETPSISGTVTDSNGNPVEDYCVSATRFTASHGHTLLDVRTDSSGEYKITGAAEHLESLPPGNYRIEFRRCQSDSVPSNEHLISEWWDDKRHISDADTIVVGEGADVTDIDAELQIGGVISGTVRNADGDPIQGCVSLRGPETAAGIQTAAPPSPSAGQFAYERLLPGEYRLRYDDCGTGPGNLAAEWYEHKPTFSEADEITLAPAEQRTGMDVRLGLGGSIAGTVTGPDGGPLAGVCVHVYDADGERHYSSIGTDSAGEYAFHGLFAADYRVGFVNCNQANVLGEFYDDAATLEEATPIAVTVGATATANAELARSGSISGLVRGPDQLPLEDACVEAFDESGQAVGYTSTGGDGRYTIVALETGSYRVGFDSCGSTEDDEDFEEFWDNEGSLEEADEIAVTAGSDRPGVNATLGADDPLAPETSLLTPTISGSSAEFTFSSTVPGSTFECRVPGLGDFEACVSPHTLSDLADGVYTFEVYAISPAGLIDESPASRGFTITAEADCLDARSDLAAAQRALGKAKKAVKRAKKAIRKAKKSGSAKKLKKAKKALKRAKAKKRSAKRRAGMAQAEVDRLCP